MSGIGRTLALPLALGLIGLASGTAANASSLSCAIRVEEQGSAVVLEGVVTTRVAVDGTYSLRITGSGTDISQGGHFSAYPGAARALGQVTLAGGGPYTAELEVSAGGRTANCTEQIGGVL